MCGSCCGKLSVIVRSSQACRLSVPGMDHSGTILRRMMTRCEKSMLDSQTWDGRAIRPAALRHAQAHGQGEAGRGWTTWGGDGVSSAKLRPMGRARPGAVGLSGAGME